MDIRLIRKTGLIITILLMLISGCASSLFFQYMKPEYKGDKKFNATVVVMPITAHLIGLENLESIVGDKPYLGGYASKSDIEYFNNYMGAMIAEAVVADVYGIDPLYHNDSLSFAYEQVHLNNETPVYMFIPQSGVITYRDIVPNFVLFFDHFRCYKSVEETSIVGVGMGSSRRYRISVDVEYLLWDNKNQKIASLGRLSKERTLLDTPDKNAYIMVLESVAKSIVRKSPLAFRQL